MTLTVNHVTVIVIVTGIRIANCLTSAVFEGGGGQGKETMAAAPSRTAMHAVTRTCKPQESIVQEKVKYGIKYQVQFTKFTSGMQNDGIRRKAVKFHWNLTAANAFCPVT